MLRIVTLSLLIVVGSTAGATVNVCELVELDSLAVNGNLGRPSSVDNIAYVPAGAAGIAKIDIRTADDLVLLGSDPTQDEALDLVVEFFQKVLVVADGDAGVSTYSSNSAGEIDHLGTYDFGERIISVAGFSSQFQAGGGNGTLFTFTLNDEYVPEPLGSVILAGPVRKIVQRHSWLYCALGAGGLAVVDVSDPENPSLVGTPHDLGGDVLTVERDNDVLYCGVQGIGVVSLRIEGETLVPQVFFSLPEAPTGIVTKTGRIYMAVPGYGVQLADGSLGEDLLLISEVPVAGAAQLLLSRDVVYVTRGEQGFSTVDVTDCAGGVQPTTYYIPAAARGEGNEGTFWVTDVAVANLSNSPAVFNMAYLEKGRNNAVPVNTSFSIEAGAELLFEDVFDSVYELLEGNGGLRLTASHPDVKATSRTYNTGGAEGTYGQFIPAFDLLESLAPGVAGALLQLQQTDDFRTNIGLLNRTPLVVEVQVDFYRADGTKVGTRIEELQPYEMEQFPMRSHTGQLASGYAVISVLTADGRVYAYASVIDNTSGDPIYVSVQELSTSGLGAQ